MHARQRFFTSRGSLGTWLTQVSTAWQGAVKPVPPVPPSVPEACRGTHYKISKARWYLCAAGAEGLARGDAHGLGDALRHFQAADGWRQPAVPGRRPRQIGDVYHLLQELGRLRSTQHTARQIHQSPPVSLSLDVPQLEVIRSPWVQRKVSLC
jgi:hypothetical protein